MQRMLAFALALPCLLAASPAHAERAALDTRAPDMYAPAARTMPKGRWELAGGLGAAFGPKAPLPPITPIPQLLATYGASERTDILIGLFGAGPSVFGRYNLVPETLNFEAGVQLGLLPTVDVEPLMELQLDVPVGPLRLHFVPAFQPSVGPRTQLSAFGVAGVEWPLDDHWDVSASLKTTWSQLDPLDYAPAAGLRFTPEPCWAVEAVGLMQRGAPAGLLYGARRF